MYSKIFQKMNWNFTCNVSGAFGAMTVRVGFSHRNRMEDEAEFCIEAWNVEELSDLFNGFCCENQFENVDINYIDIVAVAADLDMLSKLECEVGFRGEKI